MVQYWRWNELHRSEVYWCNFELARKQFGQKADDYIGECYSLHEAFALSLRPAKSSDALKERLMAMVRDRQKRQA